MEADYNILERIEELELALKEEEVGSEKYFYILKQLLTCSKFYEEIVDRAVRQANEEAKIENEMKNNAEKNANAREEAKMKFIVDLFGKGCFIAALLFATVWSVNNPTITKLAEKLIPVAVRM